MKNQGKSAKDERHDLAPLDSARLAATGVPTRVRIAPWGDVESTRGRFVVDAESAAAVVAAFAEHGTDLPIDYEHQTLGGAFTSPTGQAPAAGWIKRIEAEPGVGIFAMVEWTDPAIEQLRARQYRYLSPVALVRRTDRRLMAIHSVALTNKPAIVGMDPIVNRDVAESATFAALRDRLALAADCDVAAVLAEADRRLERWEHDTARREADRRVEALMREGRATRAQRDFALHLALRDPELFEAWASTAPVVVPLGQTAPPGAADGRAQHGAAVGARTEYRAHAELAALTSEEAYVAEALRQQGLVAEN